MFERLFIANILFLLCALQATLVTSDPSPKDTSALPECISSDARAVAVKNAFVRAYQGYLDYAKPHDELLPLTNGSSDSRNGWGATIVDALDTMLIMGLNDQYKDALTFVSDINFSKSDTPSKGFETNIRYLGGLLSANDIKPDPILVKKAREVADQVLLPLFDPNTGVPATWMNLNTKKAEPETTINLAEFGTYSLEFTRLSQVTGDQKYAKLANTLIDRAIAEPSIMPGLYPTAWDFKTFKPINNSIITVGAGGDSFYEYLIKNYILLGGENKKLLTAWTNAVESMRKYMLSPTKENPEIQFIAMINNSTATYASDELICFWPGNIMLGLSQMTSPKDEFHDFAEIFMNSCQAVWDMTKTSIAPEAWTWTPAPPNPPPTTETKSQSQPLSTLDDIAAQIRSLFSNPTVDLRKRSETMEKKQEKNTLKLRQKRKVKTLGSDDDDAPTARPFKIASSVYNLRPETIESLFYYYRITGDSSYQDTAWKWFQAIDKYTATKSGNTFLLDVDSEQPGQGNFQESFFFAETLKYLYLMFTDTRCLSLDEYVYNTEAHPFKLPKSVFVQKSSE